MDADAREGEHARERDRAADDDVVRRARRADAERDCRTGTESKESACRLFMSMVFSPVCFVVVTRLALANP